MQGAFNAVSAFVKVYWIILNAQQGSITEIFVNVDGVKGPKSHAWEEEVVGLPEDRRFVMEYLQNLDNGPTNVQRAGDTISRKQSNWCWKRVNIVGRVC